jgi:hypothetical protein
MVLKECVFNDGRDNSKQAVYNDLDSQVGRAMAVHQGGRK